MFNNIGGKIKGLTVALCGVGIGISVIAGLAMMITDSDMFLLGLCTAALGPLIAWISSFMLYGFGQLIENSDTLVAIANACGGKNTLVGTWKYKDYGITITFKSNGTAIYKEDGETEEMEWELVDDVILFDGDESGLTFEDGRLTMHDDGEVCVFKKK